MINTLAHVGLALFCLSVAWYLSGGILGSD
jgi:hypothetical protein